MSIQEDSKLGGISREIRDGHKLVVTLSANHWLGVDVVCPQDAGRKCKWEDGKHIEAHGPCWLRYLVKDAGSEFLEWWTGGGPERVDLTAGPIEIEWWVDGGDEPEVWWRPVHPSERNER